MTVNTGMLIVISAECRYAECSYAECRGAQKVAYFLSKLNCCWLVTNYLLKKSKNEAINWC